MILPKDVKGYNRIRDAKIIELYCEEGHCQTEIARRFHLTQGRIATILNNNSISIIERRKDWEKIKRIHSYSRMLNNPKIPEANTKVEVLKELRKEFEGDEKDVTINNVTYNIQGERKVSVNRIENVSSENSPV